LKIVSNAREDFPERDDKNWLKRTLATWKEDNDLEPTLTYEDLDVKSMELPPGFRGYGKDMTIQHKDSQKRTDEVEDIREKMRDEGKSRFEIQEALMPYCDKLPELYKGKNERLQERFDEQR